MEKHNYEMNDELEYERNKGL